MMQSTVRRYQLIDIYSGDPEIILIQNYWRPFLFPAGLPPLPRHHPDHFQAVNANAAAAGGNPPLPGRGRKICIPVRSTTLSRHDLLPIRRDRRAGNQVRRPADRNSIPPALPGQGQLEAPTDIPVQVHQVVPASGHCGDGKVQLPPRNGQAQPLPEVATETPLLRIYCRVKTYSAVYSPFRFHLQAGNKFRAQSGE